MTLEEAVQRAPEFKSWGHADRIRFFMWYLHTYQNRSYIAPRDVAACFDKLHVDGPTNLPRSLAALSETRPKQALKSKGGYRLEHLVRADFDSKYGQRASTQQLTRQLQELEGKITNAAQKAYLDEVLICFKNKAHRAAIVMAWNLAYDHLLRWILNDAARLATFNAYLAALKNQPVSSIRLYDDFSHLKEDLVLTIARKAPVISNSLHKVLDEKLRRRNAVAHPGGIKVNDVTAEDVIRDLMDNVVIALQ
ncbi:MAG TPA: hypothetical protein VFB22_13585 [Candidatus Baltobacteraceae bacterium]|nr:hypothetical protein [Candidatus Baltobacteraceae bacterium]